MPRPTQPENTEELRNPRGLHSPFRQDASADVDWRQTSECASLYDRSGAATYRVSLDEFASILLAVQQKYLPHGSAEEVREFCAGLRLEELVLARACAAGNETAWQDFVSRFRRKMHSMALHITREAAQAADLADSLFADLYGVNSRDEFRKSKLLFYTGRGSLEGWLRTVMAQEFVNRYRKQKRSVSLEEKTEEGVQFAAPVTSAVPACDRRLIPATDQALGELSAEDRFVLAAYFLDGRTLADIARALSLHESSVSRRLDRISVSLRKRILASLREQGMSHAQAAEALDTDVRDLQLNLRERLAQESVPRAFPEQISGKAEARSDGNG